MDKIKQWLKLVRLPEEARSPLQWRRLRPTV